MTSLSQENVQDLALTLVIDSDIDSLTDTIRGCTAVETVDISCPNSQVEQPQWSSASVQRLFEQIGSLPKLRAVSFKFLGWGDHDNSIPLSLFTALLNQSSTIVKFKLVLVGPISCPDASDLHEFCGALSRQTHLRDFRLASCYFAHEWLSSPHSHLDPILLTLAQLPSLEIVNLKAANKGHLGRLQTASPLGPSSLGALCLSPGFKHLCLDNLALGNYHVNRVANALATNTSCLQDVYLNLSAETNLNSTNLPMALQANQSLRRLQLRLAKQKTLNEFLLQTSSALHSNTTLKEFSAFGGFAVCTKVEQAFCEMLESNCILETLGLPSNHSGNEKRKIDMLLQFNGQGQRQRLLAQSETIPMEEWVGLFANQDLTFVYYYVRHISPRLCKRVLE